MNERRRNTRWPLNKRQAKFRVLPKQDYRQCVLENISFGGCRIICQEDLSLGSQVEIAIALPSVEPIVAQAEVVWGRRETFYQCRGMRFTRFRDSDKEKIYRHISDTCKEQLSKRLWNGVR